MSDDILLASDLALASFGIMDHQIILLQRQEHVIEIKGITLSRFKSYVSGIFQFVHVNDESFMHMEASAFLRVLCLKQ